MLRLIPIDDNSIENERHCFVNYVNNDLVVLFSLPAVILNPLHISMCSIIHQHADEKSLSWTAEISDSVVRGIMRGYRMYINTIAL